MSRRTIFLEKEDFLIILTFARSLDSYRVIASIVFRVFNVLRLRLSSRKPENDAIRVNVFVEKDGWSARLSYARTHFSYITPCAAGRDLCIFEDRARQMSEMASHPFAATIRPYSLALPSPHSHPRHRRSRRRRRRSLLIARCSLVLSPGSPFWQRLLCSLTHRQLLMLSFDLLFLPYPSSFSSFSISLFYLPIPMCHESPGDEAEGKKMSAWRSWCKGFLFALNAFMLGYTRPTEIDVLSMCVRAGSQSRVASSISEREREIEKEEGEGGKESEWERER